MSVLLCLLSTVSLVSWMATGSQSFSLPCCTIPWVPYRTEYSTLHCLIVLFLPRNSLCKGGQAHPGTNTPTELSGHGAQSAKNAQPCPPPNEIPQMPAGSWQGPCKEASVSLPWLPAQNPALNSSNLPPYLYPSVDRLKSRRLCVRSQRNVGWIAEVPSNIAHVEARLPGLLSASLP